MKKYHEFINEKVDVNLILVSEFFGKLFQSRDVAHLVHLKTESYEIHKALNDYYDNIIDLIDSLVEAYQGIYTTIDIVIPMSMYNEPLSYFGDLESYVKENKDVIFTDSNLINGIEEILDEIDSLLYKLRFLK